MTVSAVFDHGRITFSYRGISAALVAATIALFGASARTLAQGGSEINATTKASFKAPTDDMRYRIGPGDVITIVVRKAQELSGPVRVDQRGMIRIPMIDDEVPAACRTESELATEIATLYRQYKNNPSVEVFVTDFQSRPVSVIGAVNAPGQFRLQRQVRLLELLSFAGGPSVLAGRVVNVIHTGGPDLCGPKTEDPKINAAGITVYELNETLKGKAEDNPFVQPGDMVSLPEADQVFVTGHVNAPRAISLKDKPISVSRAIAMAGGPARDGKTDKIKIIRDSGNGQKQEIVVDLRKIEKQQAPDLMLVPNDVVQVGASVTKTFLQMLTGSASGAISNGVIRAIP